MAAKVVPSRVGVKFSPPTIALEYAVDTDSSFVSDGDVKVLEVPLDSAPQQTQQEYLAFVQRQHPDIFNASVVSLPQVRAISLPNILLLRASGCVGGAAPRVARRRATRRLVWCVIPAGIGRSAALCRCFDCWD
jgi:hypothetical protein